MEIFKIFARLMNRLVVIFVFVGKFGKISNLAFESINLTMKNSKAGIFYSNLSSDFFEEEQIDKNLFFYDRK